MSDYIFQLYLDTWGFISSTESNFEIMDRTTCQVCLREVENNKHICVSILYGALSCKACQRFFRRTVQRYGTEDLETVFKCDMKDCGLGYRCQKTRLHRCLQCGMDPNRVVLDETKRKKLKGMIYSWVSLKTFWKRIYKETKRKRKISEKKENFFRRDFFQRKFSFHLFFSKYCWRRIIKHENGSIGCTY